MPQIQTISRIVLVGHCGIDRAMLGHTLRKLSGGIPVTNANDLRALEQAATSDSLLLVNRVLEHGLGTSSGLDLIRDLAGREHPPQMMLVSNYEDAQQQAVEAGALPGFGKADPRKVIEQCLQQVLAAADVNK